MSRNYYNVWQVLQSVWWLLQSAIENYHKVGQYYKVWRTIVTKCDRYYKMRHEVTTKCGNYYEVKRITAVEESDQWHEMCRSHSQLLYCYTLTKFCLKMWYFLFYLLSFYTFICSLMVSLLLVQRSTLKWIFSQIETAVSKATLIT